MKSLTMLSIIALLLVAASGAMSLTLACNWPRLTALVAAGDAGR